MKTVKVNACIMHIFGKIELFFCKCNQKLFQNALLKCLLRGKDITIYRTLEIWKKYDINEISL